MKILYDYQMFNNQQIGGISRYFYEIANNNNLDEIIFGLKYTDNLYLQQSSKFTFISDPNSYKNFYPNLGFRGKHKLYNLRNKLFKKNLFDNKKMSINLLEKGDFDVLHSTYYDPYFLEYIGNKPHVMTIHDMIYEKLPEFYKSNDKTAYNKRIIAEKASHIITISEYTKKDIMDLYDIPEEKISVVYHGSSLKSDIKSVNYSEDFKEIIRKKYILFTGTRFGYKNFNFFVRAISNLLKNDDDLYLVCTGSSFTSEEKDLFFELQINNKILHYFANDSDLYTLYNKAQFFVFPSYYEGFGIPILEAFEAECPVILANASCFPEIAGDAALYFNPKSKSELEYCCKELLNNTTLRAELIKKGNERKQFFSWKKASNEIREIYKKNLQI